MHLVEDDEFVLMLIEIEFRFGEFCAIRVGFQIKIDGCSLLTYIQCKRRLSDLAGVR